MTEVDNLDALRYLPPTTDETVYVKGHSNIGDGGGGIFMWRTDSEFQTGQPYGTDNDGTIIEPYNTSISPSGRWIRQYEGYINILYFGGFGVGGYYNEQFQRAIDFASLNSKDTPKLKGSTVFIPNGQYELSNIILKSGVSILGESVGNTIIRATNLEQSEYLFRMEKGPVFLSIYNLKILGNGIEKGCFLFEGKPISDDDKQGGLWYSTIKNVTIGGFLSHGIYLKGGIDTAGGNSFTPNQFNIFENVRVNKYNNEQFSHYSHALLMTGQNGQHTFINCQFDGYTLTNKEKITTYDKVINVSIENIKSDPADYLTSNVITFLNCTIQNSDYGVKINYAENITFDNCWFENLGVSLTIVADTEPTHSKSINILNNRFANASGFGFLKAPNNIREGMCVYVKNSVVNIYNNYVTVSGIEDYHDSYFVIGEKNNNGINCYNNTFTGNNPKLGKTYGIMQAIQIVGNAIDCKSNKLIFINPSDKPTIIKNIISTINAGETLVIRANGETVTFESNTGNIFLTNRSTFSLLNGEIATFIKIDVGTDNVTYQLLSFTKTTP